MSYRLGWRSNFMQGAVFSASDAGLKSGFEGRAERNAWNAGRQVRASLGGHRELKDIEYSARPK